ncbi:MAG: hypothetical protein ACRCTI_06615 [Beijerinckiaceae bacterium]
MGQAKRRREAGGRISWCRTCTYCCVLPEIAALGKPMYRRCRHIENDCCGIFGRPERPSACTAYACAYLAARLAESPDRNRIPHPLDAGAYFHRDPVENAVVLFVDPARPQAWKASAIPGLLRPELMAGRALVIFDRGRQMTISSPELFEAVLARDMVAFAEAEGRPLDVETFAEWRAS